MLWLIGGLLVYYCMICLYVPSLTYPSLPPFSIFYSLSPFAPSSRPLFLNMSYCSFYFPFFATHIIIIFSISISHHLPSLFKYGFPPFQGQSNEEIIMKIVHCNYEFPKEVPVCFISISSFHTTFSHIQMGLVGI